MCRVELLSFFSISSVVFLLFCFLVLPYYVVNKVEYIITKIKTAKTLEIMPKISVKVQNRRCRAELGRSLDRTR